MRTIICDIDGVLADYTHRLKYLEAPADWDAFFSACDDDEPLKPMIELLWDLSLVFRIVYVTGRPERTRDKTVAWFITNRVPWLEASSLLFMREDGDHRQDYIIKQEIHALLKSDIAAVIEDRDQVVQIWRGKGLLCLQPKKGDY